MSNIRDQTRTLYPFIVKLSEEELLDLLIILEEDKSEESYYLYDIVYNAWIKN